MSSERKYTGMAKLFAIEEQQKKERDIEKAHENIAGGENSSPPANISAPAIIPTEPLQFSAPEEFSPPAIFSHPEQHTRIPNEIFESVLPTLTTSEQSVLLRLYRLTWGFQKDTCHVSMGKLGKYCHLSSRQVSTCIHVLEKRRLIKRLNVDLDNKNQSERGVTFQILLPQAARAKSSPPANFSGGANISAPEEIADNKRKALKENSKRELAPPDTKNCPDCDGMGVRYIDPLDYSKGTVKCKHERMGTT